VTRNILVVANHFPPEAIGGAEVVAHRQALALRQRGFEVTVLAGAIPREGFESGALRVDEVDGLTVYRLAVQSHSPDGNFHWPAAAARLRAIVESCGVDIVHFHNVTGLGANLIAEARSLGCRTVVTLHDHWGFCFKNTRLHADGQVCSNAEDCGSCLSTIVQSATAIPIRLRRDYVAWCLEQADLLISPSAYMADAYEQSGVIRRRATVLSNGVNNDAIPVSIVASDDEVSFVAFAYLGEHKGIPVLLKAAERLAAEPALQGRWSLTIAGHGHLEPEVRQAAADKRFKGALRYAGRLKHEEALALLGESDVAVLASVWPENEPVTMLEAISTGTAQLASRLGGNLELVDEDASGLMFPAGDAKALAAAMRRFILEPGLATSFGAYNAARRERFAERESIDRLEQVLAALEPEPDLEEIVVLCVGDAPPADLPLAIQNLYGMEAGDRPIRLVWHEWAGIDLWRQARLVWFWGGDGRLDPTLLSRALRYGVPVLAPEGSPTLAAAGVMGAPYRSLLEAMAWIASLQDVPSMDGFRARAGSGARLLNAGAARSSFLLSSKQPA
jgi:glycosyltransferase involved in cell wall biosynthesis